MDNDNWLYLEAQFGKDILTELWQGCNRPVAIACAQEMTNCLQVLAATLGQEEQHSLATNDWMYWELNLAEEAASMLVQLNRTAGDLVLFLKPASAGFVVSPVHPDSLSTCRLGAAVWLQEK